MRISRREFVRAGALCAGPALASSSRLWRPEFGIATDDVAARLAADPLRPEFHLLPARNWMNDPNGPIFWAGNYHMFFQYNPGAAVWGDMHWAHAVSPDMIHWRHLPVALAPTPGGPDQDGCFSGSAVADGKSAAMLYTGVKTAAPSEATLRDGTHNFLETQCLATCDEPSLQEWKKVPGPVLLPPKDAELTGFRDPCVWREDQRWLMGIGSGVRGKGGRVLLYESKNLREWEYLHVLASGQGNGKKTADFVDSGEMWECPDFFAVGDKHVLLYSTERKVYWQTGSFDRGSLVFHIEKQGLLDSGAFYAPKSQTDASGRRVLWGWIPETRPEAEFSAAGWAGCMSLPRVLDIDGSGQLVMRFLPELRQLRGKELSGGSVAAFGTRSTALEGEFSFGRAAFELKFESGGEQWLTIAFDPASAERELRIGEQVASVPGSASMRHEMHLFVDASVVECIVDGKIALTSRNYRKAQGELRLTVAAQAGQHLERLRFWEVAPISKDRLTSAAAQGI